MVDAVPKGLVDELASIVEENARLLRRLEEGERRFRVVSRGVVRLQEEQLGRFSRELHDGVGQTLTALKMRLEMLLKESAKDPARASQVPALSEIVALSAHALDDVRQVSRLLRPPMLNDLGLVPTLRWLTRSISEQTGLLVTLETAGLPERLDDAELSTLVFRLVQEALTNVVKHASATRASVRVAKGERQLTVAVRDDGRGFDAEVRAASPATGVGLRGMRDRVSLHGGTLVVRSNEGAGTLVEATIPATSRDGEEERS